MPVGGDETYVCESVSVSDTVRAMDGSDVAIVEERRRPNNGHFHESPQLT